MVFYLDIATGSNGGTRLLLRCDSEGNVWASVEDMARSTDYRRAA